MSKRALLLTFFSLLFVVWVVPTLVAEHIEAKPCKPGHPCSSPSPSAKTSPSPSPTFSGDPVITAAGDIAEADPSSATRATADLVESINPSVVLTLGDNQYPSGLLSDYLTGYDPTWGSFLSRTFPAPGNHEYNSSSTAAGYFDYFGSRAPDAYYSYNVGAWHLISLNSNCSRIGGCGSGSAEYNWLEADLAAHPTTCTLAYWHHPSWSSGTKHGGTNATSQLWTLLYDAGAELVLSGHEHNYERFAPQDPSGSLDEANGVVQIVAGTGGKSHYPFGSPKPNSVARSSTAFGVLKLTLHATSYDFAFQPIPGDTFTDSGTESCH
jgi:hypothetical protein